MVGCFPGKNHILSLQGAFAQAVPPAGSVLPAILGLGNLRPLLAPGRIRSCHPCWLLHSQDAVALLYSDFSQTYLLPQLGPELLEGGDLVLLNSDLQDQGRESWHGVRAAEEGRKWDQVGGGSSTWGSLPQQRCRGGGEFGTWRNLKTSLLQLGGGRQWTHVGL